MSLRLRGPGRLDAAEIERLAEVLIDCVAGGASVSFMAPLSRQQATDFWRGVDQGLGRGDRLIVLAEDVHGIVGTVQLLLAQPPNQPHRADLSKMLVHRRGRRQGVGAALLKAAEAAALAHGKHLLVLDTASTEAERLYERNGWQRVGLIPDFALWPTGGFCPTVIFYRDLRAGVSGAQA